MEKTPMFGMRKENVGYHEEETIEVDLDREENRKIHPWISFSELIRSKVIREQSEAHDREATNIYIYIYIYI